MTRKYFGTDGIRGTVGQAPITPDFVLRLAHAVGRVLKPGRRLIVTTADVKHVDDAGKESPCALMQQTLVPVPKTY